MRAVDPLPNRTSALSLLGAAMFAIAALPGSTQPQVIDVPDPPPPGPGEVLCQTLELGVCGTDREILLSAQPHAPPGESRLILGHECLARVTAVGAGVTDWAPGDLAVPVVRRAIVPTARRADLLPFGNQFVERGIYREHGFSAERWLDRPEHLVRVPTELASLAVFTEPLAVAEKGINEALLLQQARLGADAWTNSPPRVLVSGMGPIGFAAVLAARARGWPATMWGRDEPVTIRARLAEELGAVYLPATLGDFPPADAEAAGFDLILECTGSDDVMVRVAPALASCGVMVWLGSSRAPQPAERNVARLMRDGLIRNHVYLGCVNAAPRDFADALAHLAWARRELPQAADGLITARVPPADALPHYEHRQPQGVKTVIAYQFA